MLRPQSFFCKLYLEENKEKSQKKVLTFVGSGDILTKLSRETNESHRTVKNKLKKLLTSDGRCDNLIKLSREQQQRTLITEQ